MKRTPLVRKTPLTSTTKIKKVNPERAKKRGEKKRKHYASPEYKAARKAQMVEADGQCEFIVQIPMADFHWAHRTRGRTHVDVRCPQVDHLQFHEEHYGSDLGIIREIRGKMYCPRHHAFVERRDHPTRQRRSA